jgi:hypothetical protein
MRVGEWWVRPLSGGSNANLSLSLSLAQSQSHAQLVALYYYVQADVATTKHARRAVRSVKMADWSGVQLGACCEMGGGW